MNKNDIYFDADFHFANVTLEEIGSSDFYNFVFENYGKDALDLVDYDEWVEF